MQAIPALPVAGPANPAPLPQAVEVDTVTVPAQSAGLVIDRTNLLAHSNTRYAEMPQRLPRLNARERPQREPRERTARPLVEPRRLGPPPVQPARRAPAKAAPAKGPTEPQRSSRPARATRGYP